MRIVIQRVSEAKVEVGGQVVAGISGGLLLFVGVGRNDRDIVADRLAAKIAKLRIMPDAQGKMNRSVIDAGGEILVVSQFTLYADTRRGNRPGFEQAELPERARALVSRLINQLTAQGIPVQSGVFGADMKVSLVNDGPVTLHLDSE